MSENIKDKVQQLVSEALQEFENSQNLETLKEVEGKYLGRKGQLTEILKTLKNLSPEEKPIIGQIVQKAKKELENHYQRKLAQLENEEINKKLHNQFFDLTIPGIKTERGTIHPLSQVQEEVENIFAEMGFSIADGPEVESEYYNFEALNIPATHPARDMQDTFFIDTKEDKEQGRLVLRTHTSPGQVRTMLKLGAPLKIIIPGRTFRYEATDASHDSTFYQVEGLLIDKHISLAHLKGVIHEFLSRLFQKEVTLRLRPGYFPFVEPAIEFDFACLICNQKGCRVCKHSGWIEFMGSGMVHPHVLKAGKIDPNEYQGWAFGFGLSRLVLMRYEIDDVRHLMGSDLRFLKQF